MSVMEWMDDHSVIATVILFLVMGITLGITIDMVNYAVTNPPSMEKAAIIAAVLTPISGLQAAVISFYNKRKEQGKIK
jgi:hypothetical protein